MGHPQKVAEDEVKLGAAASFVLPDLVGDGAGDAVASASVVDLGERTLAATYWDTRDLRLTRAGLSLRHRSAGDGSERGWTVKLPAGDAAGDSVALRRSEVAFSGPEDEPPAEAVSLVRATTRGRQLEPVARLVTRRARRHVVDGAGRVALEVADDEVTVLDGDQVADRFREIEVEVAPGEHDGADLLPLVVERLREAGAGAPDPTPKIARALGPRALAPPDVVVGVVRAEDPAGAVVKAAIAAGTRRLVANDPGVRLGGDDEAVHQARVATRRLRSDLATFRPLLDRGWVADVRAELGWLAGELGAARDADVLMERLRGHTEQLGGADAAAASCLLRLLGDERTTAGARAAAALDTPRYVALLDQLVGASQIPPLTERADRRADHVVPRLVGKAWRQLADAVDQAGDDPPAELLHEVRKKAKRCRYACEAAAGVCGKDAKRLAAAVAGIQEVLGDLQDAAVAEGWLRSRAVGLTGPDAAGCAFAAGLLTAMQQRAAEGAVGGWRAAWKAASSKKLRKWLA